MGYTLQNHFSYLVEENQDYLTLKEVFDYNKPLIKGALQQIDKYFETYSMHDISHSLKIINYIERFLGEERIKQLSITDTFLLLMASMLHDFGMIITFKKAQIICTSKKFNEYLEELEDLNVCLEDLDFFKNPNSLTKAKDWPINAIKSYKKIISGFVRASHPLYSSEELLENFIDYDINLNPNKIFPERVIETLAEICRLHGTNFDEVLKLEHVSNGAFDDYMHPRYIASLIRIGDLLDLDNNRLKSVNA